MFGKIKEFNEKNRNIYFFVAMLVLIGMLFINSLSGNKKTISNDCTTPSNIISNSYKYSYSIKIQKTDEVILATIKKYGNKMLIEKTEKGKLTNYYLYFSDIYEEDSTGKYIIFRDSYFVDGLDNKFFYIDYINEISSSVTGKTTDGKTCYTSNKEGVYICIDDDDIITLTKGDITITYEISNKNVTDFNVDLNNNV